MKILLVRPITDKMPIIIPNLGLGYLASVLKKNSYEVDILDCAKLDFNYEKFRSFLKSRKFDMIGIQTFTCDFTSSKNMIDMIKEHDKKIITVMGGPHISGIPADTMNRINNLDYGFCGESETGLL